MDEKISSIIENNSEQSDSESITELSLENNNLGNNKKNFSDKYITHLETEIINYKLKTKKTPIHPMF